MVYSDSLLISETINPFRRVGRTAWTGDRPIGRPLPSHDSTTQKNAVVVHQCAERDSNPRSQCSSGLQDHTWSNIIRVMKSRRMRWAVHVARREDEKCVDNFSRKTWRKDTTWETVLYGG